MIDCFQFCLNFAFKFNLRRYNKVVGELACSRGPGDYDTQCSDEHLDFHCKIDDDEDGRSDAQDLVGRCRLTL